MFCTPYELPVIAGISVLGYPPSSSPNVKIPRVINIPGPDVAVTVPPVIFTTPPFSFVIKFSAPVFVRVTPVIFTVP